MWEGHMQPPHSSEGLLEASERHFQFSLPEDSSGHVQEVHEAFPQIPLSTDIGTHWGVGNGSPTDTENQLYLNM